MSVDDEYPGIHNGERTRKRRRTRNAADGGRRRPRGAADDDRPRGFQPQRMRALWSDIDEARDKLGLGAGERDSADSWNVGALIDRALDVTRGATNQVSRVARFVSPCGFATWLARVPIVGWLVAFFPGNVVRSE